MRMEISFISVYGAQECMIQWSLSSVVSQYIKNDLGTRNLIFATTLILRIYGESIANDKYFRVTL